MFMVSIFMINSCFVVVCLIFFVSFIIILRYVKVLLDYREIENVVHLLPLKKHYCMQGWNEKQVLTRPRYSIKIIKYSSNASVYYAWRVCSTLPILFLHFLEIHLFMKIFGVKGHAGDKKMCPLGMDRLSVPPR